MIPAPVRVSAAARRDLADHVRWLRQEADTATAERFAVGVEASFRRLVDHPGLGNQVPNKRPELAGARKRSVRGFPNVLIFYLEMPGGPRILRVLHAAQDWKA